MKAHLLGAWATPAAVPVCWYLQDYVGPRPVMSRLLRAAASGRRLLAPVAISAPVAADAAAVLGRPVAAIEPAIDLHHFAPGPGVAADLDAAAGLPPAPPGAVRVGLVATFARWKGQEVFLEAVARLDPATPARFYVVGGPIYRRAAAQYDLGELRDRARRLGLEGRVGFTGHRDDPAAALRALDVVVHASTRPEPFGRVIAEAMACGRPVVAARDSGALGPDPDPDAGPALACPPGDPAALAAALARLIADPDLRRDLGEAGRRAALARFDRAALARRWAAVYSERDQGPGTRDQGREDEGDPDSMGTRSDAPPK
jgi:glycosyltransferase involved in cell wall biosynthesis